MLISLRRRRRRQQADVSRQPRRHPLRSVTLAPRVSRKNNAVDDLQYGAGESRTKSPGRNSPRPIYASSSLATSIFRSGGIFSSLLVRRHQLSRLRKSAAVSGSSHRSSAVSCVGRARQWNRCSTKCGATPRAGQTPDKPPAVMRALWEFKSRQ